MADHRSVRSIDAPTRHLLDHIRSTIKGARINRRWSQRRLAQAAACSQSTIARIERGAAPNLSLRTLLRVLRALGIDHELRLTPSRVEEPPIRDRAHARCVAWVARQLERSGFRVATEVEVGGGRWRGFIDILAMHPTARLLLVIEVKTEIDDVGAIDRQVGGYVEAAWPAAGVLGWRPRGTTGLLVLLATRDTDRRLQEHRAYFDRAFALRARALRGFVLESSSDLPPRGARGLAMVDPASRRDWLLPTAIDGRRTPARYVDRRDFLRAVRSSAGNSRAASSGGSRQGALDAA